MKTAFDGLAAEYNERIAGRGREWTVRHTVGRINAIAAVKGRILDLGCGTGLYTRAEGGRDAVAVGMDFSTAMVREAKRNSAGAFLCGDCGVALPFRRGVFNVVTAFDVLTYLQDLALVLSEVKRVLEPGGFFFCVVPNSRSFVRKAASFGRWGSYGVGGPREQNLFTRQGLIAVLRGAFSQAGADVIRPVPGFASVMYSGAPRFLKPLFFREHIGLGLLGWGRA